MKESQFSVHFSPAYKEEPPYASQCIIFVGVGGSKEMGYELSGIMP